MSDRQKLGVFNGLLLAAHWDAAFDAFLVSFDEGGRAISSPKLSEAAALALGLTSAPTLVLAADHAGLLAWHSERLHKQK